MPSSLLPKLGVRFSLAIGRLRSREKNLQMMSTGQLLLLSLKHKPKDKKRELGKINYTVQLMLSLKLRGV